MIHYDVDFKATSVMDVNGFEGKWTEGFIFLKKLDFKSLIVENVISEAYLQALIPQGPLMQLSLKIIRCLVRAITLTITS